MPQDRRVPCTHMFSNGTEYGFFIETQCDLCTRFRNGKCRIYNRIEDARFLGEEVFPFNDLLEWEHDGGKKCKSFTTEPIKRKPKLILPLNGQTEMEGI